MTELEKRSTNLLSSTESLRKLILENPDVPLLVFASQECNAGIWGWETCNNCYAEIGEYLDCMQEINDEKCYTDRNEFQEDLEDFYSDFDGSNAEFEQFIENKAMEYEPFWKTCIILWVDNR